MGGGCQLLVACLSGFWNHNPGVVDEWFKNGQKKFEKYPVLV